jgi:DNA-binding response OmpR family regulator
MSDHPFCPSCGFNLDKDRTVERDGYIIDPYGLVSYIGIPIRMPNQQRLLLHSIAVAPALVTHGVLSNRLDCKLECLRVYASHLRNSLRQHAVPLIIEAVWGQGYKWKLNAELQTIKGTRKGFKYERLTPK